MFRYKQMIKNHPVLFGLSIFSAIVLTTWVALLTYAIMEIAKIA